MPPDEEGERLDMSPSTNDDAGWDYLVPMVNVAKPLIVY